jgi:putative FmdB family regulatory protein
MAKYDYRCEHCNIIFEFERAITEDTEAQCPTCGNLKCKLILSAPNVIFSGQGFTRRNADPTTARARRMEPLND